MPRKGNVTRPRIEPLLMIRPSRFWRMEGSTARVTRRSPMTFVSKMTFACSAVKASVTPARHDAGIVDQHIDLAGLHQHSLDARFDRCVVANVQFHGHDAELSQGLGGLSVLGLRTPHRGVHSVASAEQRFRRVTAKAAASA